MKPAEAWDEFIPISTQEHQFKYYSFHLNLQQVENNITRIIADFACDGFTRVGFVLVVLDKYNSWCVAEVVEFNQSQIKINYLGFRLDEWIEFPELPDSHLYSPTQMISVLT